MSRAVGARPDVRAARPRSCGSSASRTPKRAIAVSLALAVCRSVGINAAAVSPSAGAARISFSSVAGRVFAPEDSVNVTYTSPFAWPVLSTWCDPASPRQESFQKATPFTGEAVVPLSRIGPVGADVGTDGWRKECWFNLRPLTDPSHRGVDSEPFDVTQRRRSRGDELDNDGLDDDDDDDGDNEHSLELRDDGSTKPTRTIGPQRKRASTPNIPSPTAQQTSGPSDAAISCPSDNRTVFTEPITAKRYVILCGRDYSSDYGAVDLRSRPAANTNECIAFCAQDKTGCTAVGWGDYRGEFMCFMKSSIGDANYAPQWRVAVEDPSQRGTGAPPQGTPQAPGSGGGSGGLTGDAKAGIGVGAALGLVLIGAGAVAIWYFEQRRQLAQRRHEVEERKLEAASGSTDGGVSGRSGSSLGRAAPPTRGSSHRSDHRQAGEGGSGVKSNAGDMDASTRHLNGPANHPAGSIRSDVSGARDGRSNEGGAEAAEDVPPHLTHVSQYIRRQQQFILDSCKQGEQATPDQPPTAQQLRKPERAWTGPTTITSFGGSDGTPTGQESVVSPWSAMGPGPGGPSSSASLLAAHPASELPVREGYQGYGPEYEMPSGAEPGQPPRPHRAPGQPVPHWGTDAAEQKFLLADMAAMKMRVLRPDDRTELP